jgi:hypothetical protein
MADAITIESHGISIDFDPSRLADPRFTYCLSRVADETVADERKLVFYGRMLSVMLGEDGEPVIGEDGTPIEVPSDFEGPKKEAPNPDYYGMDMTAALRFVWAMAYAAGSTADGWGEWSKRVMRSPMSMHAQRRIFDKALYEVALKHWFLDEEGPVGAEEQDEEG